MALNDSRDGVKRLDQNKAAKNESKQINVAKTLLFDHKVLPSPEQFEHQEKLFGTFSRLILGPFCEVRTLGNNEILYGYESSSDEGNLLLVRVGSHGLGIWKPTDPMSCLCFGSISKCSFFDLAAHRLRSVEIDGQISILKESADPEDELNEMFHVSWQGSRIGLHYRFLGLYQMNRWHDLLHRASREQILSNEAITAVNVCKEIIYIHDSVPNFDKFKIVYRFLDLWARYRGIYSERLGYLSREKILLLLNSLWKMRRLQDHSFCSILHVFFAHYSQLDWKKEIIVDPEHSTQESTNHNRCGVPAVIYSIFPPVRNTASLMSKNSLKLILREFTRAMDLTKDSNIDWQDLLGLQGVTKQKHSFSFAATQFVQRFDIFIRFEMRYWGSNVPSRIHFLNLMGTHFASLFVKLTESDFRYSLRRSNNSLAFAWPYRLRDRPKSTEAEKSFYLIGIEYNGPSQRLTPFRNSMKRECDALVSSLREDGIFDPTTGWVNITVVAKEDIDEVFSDGDGSPGEPGTFLILENIGNTRIREEIKEERSDRSLTDAVKAEPGRKLRPAADILNRLIWDPKFDRKDYIIGYDDRFSGSLEVPLDSWKTDATDEEFIPQHRILYFKRKSDNEVIWDRRTKVDKIFGTRNSTNS